MKILEQGLGWNIKQRCSGKGNGMGGCNSLLLIEENDVYVTSSNDMLGDTDYYYTFCCPICGKETDIDERKIPASIKNDKLDKYRSSFVRRRVR